MIKEIKLHGVIPTLWKWECGAFWVQYRLLNTDKIVQKKIKN
jgi:hypothetical protein